MEKWMCAKDVTELAVTVLMYGRKTKVAVKKENGGFEVQTKSIITQYLNPNNDRKKMTKRIADAVCNNFEYYMKETSDKESFAWMCGKALLFIYSVSGVDLTYILRNQYSDSAKKEISAFLLKVVQSVFERFVQRDRIRYTELEELVYTTIFDRTAFDEAAEETANAVEIPINTYAQYLPVVDASDSADGEISNVFLAYLTELIQADSQEEWIQTHGSSEDDIFAGNLSGVHWKKRYIQQKFGIFLLFQPDAWVKKEGNYLFEKIQLQLYRRVVYELLDRHDTMENRVLKHSNYFQNVMRELENYTNFMSLQVKIDKELILFGRFRIYQKEIDTPRKLIAEMIDFIFYGVSAKVGRAEIVLRGGKEHEILTEVSRDYISKYVNGEQKKFTVAVKTALYYRIKYSFENREHFASLLWQFLYYAFSLDFYMIESNEEWLRLVKELLEGVESGKSMAYIREDMQMLFDQWQLERIRRGQQVKFPPLTLKNFRHADALGLRGYTAIQSRVLNMDSGMDTIQIRNEMTAKYIELKIDRLMEKLCRTVELVEKLFHIRTKKEFKEYRLRSGEMQVNWKVEFLSDLCDENADRIAISEDELKELFSYMATLVIGSRIHSKNCNKRKGAFEDYAKRIFCLRSVRYEEVHGSCRTRGDKRNKALFDQQNAELWESKGMKNLRHWVKHTLEYLVYSEWTDENWNHA